MYTKCIIPICDTSNLPFCTYKQHCINYLWGDSMAPIRGMSSPGEARSREKISSFALVLEGVCVCVCVCACVCVHVCVCVCDAFNHVIKDCSPNFWQLAHVYSSIPTHFLWEESLVEATPIVNLSKLWYGMSASHQTTCSQCGFYPGFLFQIIFLHNQTKNGESGLKARVLLPSWALRLAYNGEVSSLLHVYPHIYTHSYYNSASYELKVSFMVRSLVEEFAIGSK